MVQLFWNPIAETDWSRLFTTKSCGPDVPVESASARAAVFETGFMAMPWVVCDTPPKIRFGVLKNTFAGKDPSLFCVMLTVPLESDGEIYVKLVSLIIATVYTPLKFVFPAELVVGTPLIRTVPEFPGNKILFFAGAAVVTVTMPAAKVSDLMPSEVEGFVTSTPRNVPEPPGDTNAMCPCGAIATCGYAPEFIVTCANAHGGAAGALENGRQVDLPLGFKSTRNPRFEADDVEVEEYATTPIFVSGSTPME